MKNVKIWLLIALLIGIQYNLKAQPISGAMFGTLTVDGTKLKNTDGESVILRGTSFSWHNWHYQYFTAGVVNWLVDDWKCNILRASIGVGPANDYISNPEWSEKILYEVVDACIAKNIYVIIDWHSHKTKTAEAVVFFAKMAQKYGNYPNIIYEIYNEPLNTATWEEVKQYSISVMTEIRKYDPDNIILVGCPHWDQDIDDVANDPINGFSNIMYTVHFYAGTHKKWLRDRCDYAISKGIPIFISEYGAMNADGKGKIDNKSWTSWLKWMDDNQISWCAWSVSAKNETCSMLKPSASVNGNWTNDDIKPYGTQVRDYLINYNSTKK